MEEDLNEATGAKNESHCEKCAASRLEAAIPWESVLLILLLILQLAALGGVKCAQRLMHMWRKAKLRFPRIDEGYGNVNSWAARCR